MSHPGHISWLQPRERKADPFPQLYFTLSPVGRYLISQEGDSLEARDNRAVDLIIQEEALGPVGPLQVLVALPQPSLLNCPEYNPT